MYSLYSSRNVAFRSVVTVGEQTDSFQIADHNGAENSWAAATGKCHELKPLFWVLD